MADKDQKAPLLQETQTAEDSQTRKPYSDQPASNVNNEDPLDIQISAMTDEELRNKIRLFESNLRAMKSQMSSVIFSIDKQKKILQDNQKKAKMFKVLPQLISNVVEFIDSPEENQDQEGATVDQDAIRQGKRMVLKTSTRQTVYLPVIGLVSQQDLKPGELVGVNKDSYLVLQKLPPQYDSRVKAMELDERPTDQYSDIGGLDKQIKELIEAIVLPMTHKERFDNIGIRPPKGILLHGPPGTGKTMMARACAAQTKATFLKLAGPQLVQMYVGDGAKMVRDAFSLARQKEPTIIFIDEIDAIGIKRFDSQQGGGRQVQRTMLELLNQMDGFQANDSIKIIAATNRPDILDPALLRSGRLDRKIELPHPNLEARTRILQIHTRKMNVDREDVNYEELARSTEDFNGAMLKAVCVEAGMVALRRDAEKITHQDFIDGIASVIAKKKTEFFYFM